MEVTKRKEYAEQWKESSELFYENNDYFWMCEQIKQYNTVLEIGCGTGHSTLALIEKGHKVIAIEKNKYCLEKSKELIHKNGYIVGEVQEDINNCDVIFVLSDICAEDFIQTINILSFDIIICWNIGTYWSEKMINQYMMKLLEYGLTFSQIKDNPESSYSEYILWMVCKIGKRFNIPVQLIDRMIDRNLIEYPEINDTYYITLKEEFNFSTIKYASKKTVSKSNGGRLLSFNQKVCMRDNVDLFLLSILLKP